MIDAQWAQTALSALTFAAILGCGLIGGVFFAFSTFVMRALGRLPVTQGIAAMQAINVAVINPWFITPFIGAAILSVVMGLAAVLRWHEPGSGYLLTASLLYLLGTFGVTIGCNVPRNDALAGLDPNDPDAAERWTQYIAGWTVWNHVRTAAALAAMILLILALREI